MKPEEILHVDQEPGCKAVAEKLVQVKLDGTEIERETTSASPRSAALWARPWNFPLWLIISAQGISRRRWRRGPTRSSESCSAPAREPARRENAPRGADGRARKLLAQNLRPASAGVSRPSASDSRRAHAPPFRRPRGASFSR